ncbi:MAG: group II intron reverse transcriptase/maturase [Victivallaceae bacterium]
MPYTEMGLTEIKLALIAGYAKREPDMQFISLAHLLNTDFLRQCFHGLDRNKAVGLDNVSWGEYEVNLDENLDSLVDRLKRKKFKPVPARRVYIPKSDGGQRPLGISAIENKIVEKGVSTILQSIYEQDFMDFSYGFRPCRNCHQALKELHNQIYQNPINHVVEADIKGFFDNVSHELLMEFLRNRIKDSSMLHLIEKFLKAGYVDNDLLVTSETGTPQGSILSPLLANVFLHYVLDEWYEKTVKPAVKGYCAIVRYADDFVCLVQYADDAERIERALQNRFNKYKLELHPEKSRRISFGRFEQENARKQERSENTFDFLGFTHFCTKTRRGLFKLGRKTCRKKFNRKCKEMTDWLKGIRNLEKPKEWWNTLKAKLRGHYQYYGVSENMRGIKAYYVHTLRMLFKWLNKRSQKKSMNWRGFNNYLQCYPLPMPKITQNFYILSSNL